MTERGTTEANKTVWGDRLTKREKVQRMKGIRFEERESERDSQVKEDIEEREKQLAMVLAGNVIKQGRER